MAGFCITAVCYNKGKSHIKLVQVREEIMRGGKIQIGAPCTVPSVFVADLIRRGNAAFQTRTKTVNNMWKAGADIHLIDNEYLTTYKNSTKRDNLANLPEF